MVVLESVFGGSTLNLTHDAHRLGMKIDRDDSDTCVCVEIKQGEVLKIYYIPLVLLPYRISFHN